MRGCLTRRSQKVAAKANGAPSGHEEGGGVQGEKPVTRVAVIGWPGSGKSSLLNKIIGKRVFAESSGSSSCTRMGVNDVYQMPYYGGVNLVLHDTPGFPDTDPANAAKNFDSIIRLFKEGEFNGVIWVVKPERDVKCMREMYSALLVQFQNLNCPVVMLVNASAAEKEEEEDEEEYDRRVEQQDKDFRGCALDLQKSSGIPVEEIFVSHQKKQLKLWGDAAVKTICDLNREPRASPGLRTTPELLEEYGKIKDKAEFLQQAKEANERAIDKYQSQLSLMATEDSQLVLGALVGLPLVFALPEVAAGAGLVAGWRLTSKNEIRKALQKAQDARLELSHMDEGWKEFELRKGQVQDLMKALGRSLEESRQDT